MTTVRFEVPGKPVSVNEMYERNRFGGVRKSDAARAFSGQVANRGLKARRAAKVETTAGQVDVLVTYYFANERPDGDGPTKLILDALQTSKAHRSPAHCRVGAGFVANDRQVRDHHVRRRIDRKRPRTEVVIGPAGEVFTLATVLEAQSSDILDDLANGVGR